MGECHECEPGFQERVLWEICSFRFASTAGCGALTAYDHAVLDRLRCSTPTHPRPGALYRTRHCACRLVYSLACVHQRYILTFSGEPFEDAEDYLPRFEPVISHSGLDDTLKLANGAFCLVATIKLWFDNFNAAMQSWRIFRNDISTKLCLAESQILGSRY